ncbi:hypothetical protein GC176_14640 [bacterium]|nr:hypothetical protein [bacterium]
MLTSIRGFLPIRWIMFFRAVAALSVALHMTVSLLGHFGLHALVGDSHCPAAVHDANVHTTASSDSQTGHAHAGCCHAQTHNQGGTHADEAAADGSHQTEHLPGRRHHSPHDEHSCDICSVLAQAQTAPTVVASPSPTLLLTELLPELDIAHVESLSAGYESRGPPLC